MDNNPDLIKTIDYMKSHWPSKVKPKWQVGLAEYPTIASRIIKDFTKGCTKTRQFIRIAGLSGSGKTTQILPAVVAYHKKRELAPVLIAARKFVEYHPHYQEIKDFYGEKDLRKMTDEFSTIMMFLTLHTLTEAGYDIVLDVTLLDPAIEQILLNMLRQNHYKVLLLMIATSPTVTEHFLKNRAWRHTKETEQEFIRATKKAMEFYAASAPSMRTIIWSVYDKEPVYDGPIENSLSVFTDYSTREELPSDDDEARRVAKINYLTADLN